MIPDASLSEKHSDASLSIKHGHISQDHMPVASRARDTHALNYAPAEWYAQCAEDPEVQVSDPAHVRWLLTDVLLPTVGHAPSDV